MIVFSIKQLAVLQTKDSFKNFEVKSYIGTKKDTEKRTRRQLKWLQDFMIFDDFVCHFSATSV